MTELRGHKNASLAASSSTEATGGLLSFCLSVMLHVGLVGAGVLATGYWQDHSGGTAHMGEADPIYVTFVQDVEIVPDVPDTPAMPEMIDRIVTEDIVPEGVEKAEIRSEKPDVIATGTVPMPESQPRKEPKAEKKVAAQSAPQRTSVATSGAKKDRFAGAQAGAEIRYIDRVRALIESKRMYPAAARRIGMEGTAIVQIRVARSGRILGHTFIQSSGHHVLDSAVEKMIKACDPLPEIPPAIGKKTIIMNIPIGFYLR